MSHLARLTILVLRTAANPRVISYYLARQRYLVAWSFVNLAFYVVGIRGGDVNVLNQTILWCKLKLINHAKLGQVRILVLLSLDRYSNHMFQYFHPKICLKTNIVIYFR